MSKKSINRLWFTYSVLLRNDVHCENNDKILSFQAILMSYDQ